MCRSWSSLLVLIILCSLLAWAVLRWEDFPKRLSTTTFVDVHLGFYGGPALRAQVLTFPPVNSTRSSLSTRRLKDLNNCSNVPTFEHPFFFFHIAKTSGTTFRTYVHEGASKCNVPSLVGCHDLPCWPHKRKDSKKKHIGCPYSKRDDYSPILCEYPDRACSSVFAGHFRPDVVGILSALGQTSNCPSQNGPRWISEPSFDCVVFLREPLSRAISYYHDKHKKRAKRKPFGNMSLEDQVKLINDKSFRGNSMVSFLSRKSNLSEAKAMLQKCVVGLQARLEDTYTVITASFPWIVRPSGTVRHEHPSSHISPEDLNPDSQQVLRSQRVLQKDILLYEYGLEQFDKQWQALQGRPIPRPPSPP